MLHWVIQPPPGIEVNCSPEYNPDQPILVLSAPQTNLLVAFDLQFT